MKMLVNVIFVTALVSIFAPTDGHKDLEELLSYLQKLTAKEAVSDETSSSTVGEGQVLGNSELINIMKLANQYKNKNQNKNKRIRHFYEPYSIHRYHHSHEHDPDRDDKSHSGYKDKILEQLLQKEKKKTTHKRLTPSNLLNSIKLRARDNVERKQTGGLNEYSKIFVVLDPSALQNRAGKRDGLSTLLSRILSQASSVAEKERQNRYKTRLGIGFRLKNNFASRRYRRDSKEMYGGGGGGGSMEDDYRPKRPRNDHGGGGGGGGGGRTAIPYIRQRGDIYERDH